MRQLAAKTVGGIKKRGQTFLVLLGLALIAAVGALDLVTGYEFSVSLFYLLPIALLAWVGGRRLGIVASTVSAIVWLAVDILSGHQYSHLALVVWNAAIRFGFFITVAWLLAEVNILLEGERVMSRSDFVTGAASASYFYVLLQSEIDRASRYGHPFSLAFVDVDDFKSINDTYGHGGGDQALRSVTTHFLRRLRRSDVLGRLGGDEFGILLPEADEITARGVMSRMQQAIPLKIGDRDCVVALSIGVTTFVAAPRGPSEAVGMADQMMYEVKRAGKNGVRFSVYDGQSDVAAAESGVPAPPQTARAS